MTQPQATLRPCLPADTPALAAIFRASIAMLAQDDYDEGQLAAWMAQADEPAFAQNLAANLTLVALVDSIPVAFASLKGKDILHMLHVHPSVARQNIGSQLCDALERLAAARGAAKITGDFSDTARPLMEKRGYEAQRRNTIALGDVWFGNTTMTKALAASGKNP